MNRDVEKMITDLQEWARGEFGEAEYEYSVEHHTRRQHRTSSGRKSGDPYYITSSREPSTREQYLANRAGGEEIHADVFFGRKQPFDYVTYERKLIKKGWRELLPPLVVGGDPDAPPKTAPEEEPPF